MGDGSALPRRRRETGVRCKLASIIEVPEEAFGPDDAGELRANALNSGKHRRRRRGVGSSLRKHGVARCFDSRKLLKEQFEPAKLTFNLGSQVHRQLAAISRPHLVQALAPIAAQRFVIRNALRKQQPLMRLTCSTRSATSVLRSRQMRR